jgi:hypothetical protein
MNFPTIQPFPLAYKRLWMPWMFFIRFQKESGIIFLPHFIGVDWHVYVLAR